MLQAVGVPAKARKFYPARPNSCSFQGNLVGGERHRTSGAGGARGCSDALPVASLFRWRSSVSRLSFRRARSPHANQFFHHQNTHTLTDVSRYECGLLLKMRASLQVKRVHATLPNAPHRDLKGTDAQGGPDCPKLLPPARRREADAMSIGDANLPSRAGWRRATVGREDSINAGRFAGFTGRHVPGANRRAR